VRGKGRGGRRFFCRFCGGGVVVGVVLGLGC